MASLNLSTVSDAETARTCAECAEQRAFNLATIGVTRVLELCVGPSLETLEHAYNNFGIHVIGNDIDDRWRRHYPRGGWIIGDALSVGWDGSEAVVFAPPLSRGCTGTREDALQISEIRPSFVDFIARPDYDGIRVMVLPARSLATREDRRQLFELLSKIDVCDIVPLVAGPRKIRKYVDVYFKHGMR